MKDILLDELKQIQLNILSDIHTFCEKEGINYSLAYGTLLGAVRHKGYIPWDDDIDIMMKRQEYERFIRIYKHPSYVIADTSTMKDYYLPFAKVCDSRTVMHEKTTQKLDIGVYVDVFPIDNMPDSEEDLDKMFSTKKFWNSIHNLKIVDIDKNRALSKNIILSLSHVFLSIIPISYVVSKMKTISIRYNGLNTSNKAVFVTADNRRKWVLPSTIYEEYDDITFEDMTFRSVKEVDKYLTAMYGDYMQLPPIDEQVSHHAYKAWWKE